MIGTNFGIYRPAGGSAGGNSGSASSAAAVNNNVEEQRPQLSDFMLQLEEYVPTVPDAVTAFYLNQSGFESNDPRIVRLISVATQKFISDIANDSLQHCKTRSNNNQSSSVPGITTMKGQKGGSKDRKYTLTMEDLSPALSDYGICVRKAQYFP